jgi:N-methylhydantoinase B
LEPFNTNAIVLSILSLRPAYLYQLKAGDLLSIRLPGSGGYGPPTEKEPEIVLWDVLNDKVSVESARKNYGVILHDNLSINEEETQALRGQVKTA